MFPPSASVLRCEEKWYLGDGAVCTDWIDRVCVVRYVPSSFSSFETFFKGEVKQGGAQNAQAMAHNCYATRGKFFVPEQVTEGLKNALVKNLPFYTDVALRPK
jgi:hypothetical protein